MFFPDNLIRYNEVVPCRCIDIGFIVQRWPGYDYIKMHRHEFIEIAYVESGDGWHVLNDRVFRCREGDCFLIHPGAPHMWLGELNNPVVIWNLIFAPGFTGPVFPGKMMFADGKNDFLPHSFSRDIFGRSLAVRFAPEENPEITRLFGSMLHEYETQETGYEEMARSLAVELLIRMIRREGSGGEAARKQKNVRQESLQDVLDYIARHYAEPVPLETLSSLVYLSPKYFSRRFKDVIGCTVTEYIRKMRISSACRLLRESGDTVTEIAGKVGYSDVKYFSGIFRDTVGVLPTQYRQKTY